MASTGIRERETTVRRGRETIVYSEPAKRYKCPDCKRLIFLGSFTGWAQPWCRHCNKAVDFYEPNEPLR